MQELARFNRQFVALLEDIIAGRPTGAAALLPEGGRELVERIRQDLARELAEIRETVTSHRLGAGDQEHIVSEEEFKFLLASEESPGDG